MAKYRKKPVTIDAVQWFGDIESLNEIQSLNEDVSVFWSPTTDQLKIPTLEGKMIADLNDYIIKGVHGELYPCKPDIFNETYEPVEE